MTRHYTCDSCNEGVDRPVKLRGQTVEFHFHKECFHGLPFTP